MSEITQVPPTVIFGAFAAMGTAIGSLWAFLSKSIERERKRSDKVTESLKNELKQCESKHERAQEELFVLTGKVNAVIGHNEGYVAARNVLQGLPESVDAIDQSIQNLSVQVLDAIHDKDSPNGTAESS